MASLRRRLSLVTLLVTLALALVMTVFQLRSTYLSGVAGLRERLDEIGQNIVPSVADSVWQVDPDRVDLLLDGLQHNEGVAYLRLQDDGGNVIERGRRPAKPVASRTFALVHREHRRFELGTLEVVMDDSRIRAEVFSRALSRGLLIITTLSAGSLLLLLLFGRWVTRHLAAMARYTRELRLDALDTPLALDKQEGPVPDEIDEVAASINRMRETINAELQMRRVHESELRAHRERLEELVAVRTQALEAQRDAVQRLANTDHLTGVFSRRHFYDNAELEVARAHRDHIPLSLLMLDIDHFKRINDTWGHAVGDVVLQAFAHACQSRLRASECFGRLGGEEFALLLPGATLQDAQRIAEHLREAIVATRIRAGDGREVDFTVSIGAALMNDLDANLDALLKRCDAALYRAKHEGRNRVVVASED
ncbi:GGDEF domain-containing protein [Lysobacter fragariae]